MTRVLVTGGTGYVGQFIVEGLLDAGYEVTVAGRKPALGNTFARTVDFRPLDLEPTADHARLFDGVDHCVHAAFHHVWGKYRGGEGDDAETFRRLNKDGSIALFKAAKAAGVKRVVFLSTRAVYGIQTPGATLTEDMECRPDTLYGEVKLAAESALAALADECFATAGLRVTGVYGQARPGARHKWQPLFDDYRAGRPIAARAGTEVHGRDAAAAVRLMLESEAGAVNGQVFNVSDMLVDRHDLLALVREKTGCPHPLPPRTDTAEYNAMATDRLTTLGWLPGGWELLRGTVVACV